MAIITVVGAVLDRGILSLYKMDGSTYVIEQGDPRLADIVRFCATELPGKTYIEVDVGGEDEVFNAYKAYEEKSGGLVKLYRIAKSKLASLFESKKPELPTHMNVGFTKVMPVATYNPLADNLVIERTDVAAEKEARAKLLNVIPMVPESKLSNAVEEILAQATPVAHEHFDESNVGDKGDKSETIIAVVNGEVIGGMEQLKPQMAHAAQTDAKGFNKFMERLATVAKKRTHSVDDLLKFMRRGDLPIADDGSIIIYKALRRKTDDLFVDIHSGNVKQRVGSFVHMDESLVDHNRNNECSNGLHVARRGYLRSFSGDVCVIAKVAPEDVIAVPTYDANKMRVCGYHILFELSRPAYELLLQDKPLTAYPEDAALLGRALSGDHPEPIEDVKITAQRGGGLVITPRGITTTLGAIAEGTLVAPKLGVTLNTEDDAKRVLDAAHVDAKTIAKQATEVKKTTMTRADEATKLHALFQKSKNKKDRATNANNLLIFKQTAKVSWTKLGLPENLTEVLKNAIAAG